MRKATYLLLLLQVGLLPNVSGQICEGNLGENIFTEGDFGSGAANIPLTNPQIAPGYNYTTQPPPNDGSYTITNNMGLWSYAFGWLQIADNSNDPNGYMMVVNASYTPGLFYEQEVEGLCENTLYVFSVDIFNLIHNGDNLIRPNVSFLINDEVVYSTGQVPENEEWNTYGFTFTTEPGQTTVTLSLQNNAPGGIGNDLALDNITFRPCGPEALILPMEIANICEDGSPIELDATVLGDQYETPQFQWQQSFDEGMTWVDIESANGPIYTHNDLSGGFYYYRYLLANDPANLLNSKCRVVSNIKIVHVVPKFYTIIDTLCEGQSFLLGDNLYSNTGIYEDSLLTSIGCDSIVTLDLTILPDGGLEPVFNVVNPSCSYLEDGSISIEQILNGTPPFSIFIDEEQNLDGGSISDLTNGDYTYLITDYFGCSGETTVTLQTPSPFVIDLGPDQELDLGEPLELTPYFSQPAISFSWEPADSINCDLGCETLDLVPVNSQTLYLIATSAAGCVASDSINVLVNTVRKVFIPNAFSPNSDGINDRFTVYGEEPNIQRIEQLLIFDRWGGAVFEQNDFSPNDLSAGWDGKARGKVMPLGTYPYVAKIRFLDGAVILYSGDLTLVR